MNITIPLDEITESIISCPNCTYHHWEATHQPQTNTSTFHIEELHPCPPHTQQLEQLEKQQNTQPNPQWN